MKTNTLLARLLAAPLTLAIAGMRDAHAELSDEIQIHTDDGDEAGWFAGANTELSRLQTRFSESRTSTELQLIGGWRNHDWLFALNPAFGWNLSDGLHSGTSGLSLPALSGGDCR